MKLTTILCCSVLILAGIFSAVYALTGFDLLLFLLFGNVIAFRAVCSLAGIAAAWLLFWLIAFRPMKFLS